MNVIIPTAVVNLPIFFDLVQPASEIKVIRETIPARSENAPTSREILKLVSVTVRGKPSVVIIRTFVIANTEIKKKQADKTAVFMIYLNKRVSVADTNIFATTAIENPANKELMTII